MCGLTSAKRHTSARVQYSANATRAGRADKLCCPHLSCHRARVRSAASHVMLNFYFQINAYWHSLPNLSFKIDTSVLVHFCLCINLLGRVHQCSRLLTVLTPMITCQ